MATRISSRVLSPCICAALSGARCFGEAKNTAAVKQNWVLAFHEFGQRDGVLFAGRSRASRDDAGGVSR
jgi:hypothetical protein